VYGWCVVWLFRTTPTCTWCWSSSPAERCFLTCAELAGSGESSHSLLRLLLSVGQLCVLVTTLSPIRERSIVVTVSVCVCVCVRVCVFVCLRAYLCKYTSDLYKIFVHDAYGSDSVLLWHGVAIRYVLPVLWMTSYLRISQGSSEWLPT